MNGRIKSGNEQSQSSAKKTEEKFYLKNDKKHIPKYLIKFSNLSGAKILRRVMMKNIKVTKMVTIDGITFLHGEHEDLVNYLSEHGYKYHHTEPRRNYVSDRQRAFNAYMYNGKYGEGYIIETPRYNTTNYCWISYFIKEKES